MACHTTIVWFRKDLRLADSPALDAARQRGDVCPLYVWSPEEEGDWQPSAASKVWLHHSLRALSESLEKIGSKLIIRRGESLTELRKLINETNADAVYWNRRYEPAVIERDSQIKKALSDDGVNVESFNGSLLFEPWEVETKQGKPYQVFSPFHRTVQAMPPPDDPLSAPKSLKPAATCKSLTVDDLDLLPDIDWHTSIEQAWTPGEATAMTRLDWFIESAADGYQDQRDRPDIDGTSRMSPHLHFGEISPRQIWHAVNKAHDGKPSKGAAGFIREVIWREFGYHLLYHFPHTPDKPLREKYSDFPWIDMREGRHLLEAWQKGMTGYPLVDAGMRQLWTTGWMHNRVRMVVASFLVKHLLISWQEGAKWFWDTLVDADLANNTLGWQWAGGCGADAAPYFRIFNPTTQATKFDTNADYIRKWIPELADEADKTVHQPCEEERGNYPAAIVDHKEARDRALDALDQITN